MDGQREVARRIEPAIPRIDRLTEEAARASHPLDGLDERLLHRAFAGRVAPVAADGQGFGLVRLHEETERAVPALSQPCPSIDGTGEPSRPRTPQGTVRPVRNTGQASKAVVPADWQR